MPLGAHQKTETLGPVIPAGEHGGGAENQGDKAQCYQARQAHFRSKGIGGQGDARELPRVLPVTGQQNHQRRAGADNEGVDNRPEGCQQALPNGLIGARGPMGHHLGADTGLIGESAATDAN